MIWWATGMATYVFVGALIWGLTVDDKGGLFWMVFCVLVWPLLIPFAIGFYLQQWIKKS